MAIYANVAWLAPGLMTVAQGERTMCNWDEDAITMAVAASRDCLTGMDKSKVAGAYLGTTSGSFADRSNAGILAEALNLKDNIRSADFTSSQKAGVAALLAGLEAADKGQILVTASDSRKTKSAWFHEMWYGDGAASLLLGKDDAIAEFIDSNSVTRDFVDHYRGSEERFDYNWEERWIREEGYMKIYAESIGGLLEKTKTDPKDVKKFIYPCFLGKAHGVIGKKLGASPEQIEPNLHPQTGECGTAHPLLMLVAALEQAEPGDKLVVAGFGQGSDALMFQVTDKIKKLPERMGMAGNLARRKEEKNYNKYLKFNELVETEMGIRAEAPKQTALSALYRKRDLILGFVGGKCEKCGTPQIPRERVCVKPGCEAVDSQVEYEFADAPATVLTYTADMLAVSVEPPAIYGMVQFTEGGRFLMDFTDCEAADVEVGVPVTLSFRKKYYDEQRGFTGYFWKAVPEPAAKAEE